jgi:DNA-directed RNA polymerase sigma subunit (sigma70/sigma32)
MEEHGPNDPVAVYLREVGRAAPLTEQEEATLFQELRGKGNWDKAKESAQRRLVESQLALVVNIVQKRCTSLDLTVELIQEGNIALMDAIKSFTEKPAGDFSAYAANVIEDAVTTRRYMKSIPRPSP